jgi:tellurite resistance protein TerC
MLEGSDFAISYWIWFIIFFTVLSLIDRFLVSRNSNALTYNLYGTGFWFLSAVAFMMFLIFISDVVQHDHSLDFFAGYIIELTLSIDNVFVFIMIFDKLQITTHKQHVILRIGIASAIIMRLIMILFAVEVIEKAIWIFYIFGSILILSALHMLLKKQDSEKIPSYRKYFVQCRKEKFFIRQKGKLVPTINLLALILVEKADVLFAVDSIPAVITVTRDTFIIFTSNVMAIAGLRALFFCLAHSANNYYYLKHGIIVILLFIGIKLMILPQGIHVPKELSLALIFIIITIAVIASKLKVARVSR